MGILGFSPVAAAAAVTAGGDAAAAMSWAYKSLVTDLVIGSMISQVIGKRSVIGHVGCVTWCHTRRNISRSMDLSSPGLKNKY